MTQKEALALADFLVAQTKPKDKVIIPEHLRFDGWLSTASQLRRSILSTFREMERTKDTLHVQSLTILKLRISDRVIRILSTLVALCSNARSIKMELEYPSIETVQFELMSNRASSECNMTDDNEPDLDEDLDYNSLMVTEENVIRYMRQLFHTIAYLPKLGNLYIRFIGFPHGVYQDYISMCFDLKVTNYKCLASLHALTFPVDHNNIQVYTQTEYWQIFKHFVHEHTLDRFTLLLDADIDDEAALFLVQATANLFNQFCNVFIPTLLHRKHPLSSLSILAQSPMNVLSGDFNSMDPNISASDEYKQSDDANQHEQQHGMCYRLIAPFFSADSIHLPTLNEFNLYLPNPMPLQDLLDLITFMLDSEHKLTKLRLELPNDQRYKKTKDLLELLAKFVSANQQLNELHLHLTKLVNNLGVKKLFRSIRTHVNLHVFEMSEMQINGTIWNALVDIFDNTNNNEDGVKKKKCNTNLQVFKVHFKYQSWHKILENEKLKMTVNDPLRIIVALYKNQLYLYQQMKALEQCLMRDWNVSKDVVLIVNSYGFNQTMLSLKVSGLAHEIKKKNVQCFNWFHELMFNQVPIGTADDDGGDEHKLENVDESAAVVEKGKSKNVVLTKESLLYALDWNILRAHVVKRQLLFR